MLREGNDVTIAVTGILLAQVLEAAEELDKAGINGLSSGMCHTKAI